jgi:hypothetical protein
MRSVGPRPVRPSQSHEESRRILGQAMTVLCDLEEFELAARLRDVVREELSKD